MELYGTSLINITITSGFHTNGVGFLKYIYLICGKGRYRSRNSSSERMPVKRIFLNSTLSIAPNRECQKLVGTRARFGPRSSDALPDLSHDDDRRSLTDLEIQNISFSHAIYRRFGEKIPESFSLGYFKWKLFNSSRIKPVLSSK